MQVSIRLPGSADTRHLMIADDGTWAEADDWTEVVGEGWWALPGLCDAHSHLAADEVGVTRGEPAEIRSRAFACLERGTFLVLDKGWLDLSVIATLTDRPPTEAPDLEAANMIAKLLIHLAGAQAAGLVVGARVPIMLTSRSDDCQSRLASAALALLLARYYQRRDTTDDE